tara:strand:- start:270 stop:1034 length:765 start_codon:yes stop_codon:yes gene_type:complete
MKTYISIASIFDKQSILLKALKSIENQTVKPDKCYINLSEEPNLLDRGFKDRIINKDLEDYISSNNMFEVKWVKNTGPFVKLLPVLEDKMDEDCAIITIDDDSQYQPEMIENYLKYYHKYDCVICHRSFNFKYNIIDEMRYNKRTKAPDKPCIRNFHTGKGGVLFHPKFFKKTFDHIFDDKIYKKCCPTNDDVWFNIHRIINDVKCFAPSYKTELKDNSVKEFALWVNFNSKGSTNDEQIVNTINCMRNLGYIL